MNLKEFEAQIKFLPEYERNETTNYIRIELLNLELYIDKHNIIVHVYKKDDTFLIKTKNLTLIITTIINHINEKTII